MMKRPIALLSLPILALVTAACSVEKIEAPAAAPPFVFDTASAEEQEVWLTEQAAQFRKGLADGLRSTMSNLKTQDPVISTKYKTIRITSQMTSDLFKLKVSGAQIQALQEKTCRDYLRTELRKQGIRTIMMFKDAKGTMVFKLEGEERKCAKYDSRI